MASPKPNRRDIRAKARELWAELTDPATGHVSKQAVTDALYAYVTGHPDLLDSYAVCAEVVESLAANLRPKPGAGIQGQLFARGQYITIGDGEWVEQEKASQLESQLYWDIYTAEYAAVVGAYAAGLRQITADWARWQPGQVWGDLYP